MPPIIPGASDANRCPPAGVDVAEAFAIADARDADTNRCPAWCAGRHPYDGWPHTTDGARIVGDEVDVTTCAYRRPSGTDAVCLSLTSIDDEVLSADLSPGQARQLADALRAAAAAIDPEGVSS